MMVRTGIGYDTHRLESGEKLIIGGIDIPFEKGSVGHSDGDVLCHAIVDAILGAANVGDIGDYFPSNDNQWEDVSSLTFLRITVDEIRQKGLAICNVDATLILQRPKIGQYIGKMKSKIGDALGLSTEQVSIKATTTDFLGAVGRGDGIAAMAVATLTKTP